MNTMKKNRCRHFLLHSALLLGGVVCAGTKLAHAGVIQGTGPGSSAIIPSSATQLGATDAVGFQMAESGPGHVLVVPYFTAQGGQMSVLHLVNTDAVNGKAVKVRYRGAGNADTLLDFVVLLSPGDVWTGAVNAGGDGRAQITTNDNSCTTPRLTKSQPQPFFTARLNPQWTLAEQVNNTREGYIEAIVMADIPSNLVYGTSGQANSPLYTAIKHIAGVAPCTSSVLDAALLNDTSSEAEAASRGWATPSGGLMGSWYIIDVPGSTTFSGSATAFTAVNSAGQSARGNYVLFPQSDEAVAQPERFTADPLLVSAGLAGRSKTVDGVLSDLTTAPALQAQFSDLPDLSTPYYFPASAANARRTAGDLTQTLAVKSVKNQYALDPSISAKTDWVLSMPTMRYSVAYDYAATGSTSRLVYSLVSPRDSTEQYFSNGNVFPSSSDSRAWIALATYDSASGVSIAGGEEGTRYFDREGTRSTRGGFFPGTPSWSSSPWPGMVSVIALGDGRNSTLSASVSRKTVSTGFFTNGWYAVDTPVPNTNLGLPILGASFIKLTNPAAQPGVSGNYGITWPHGYTR
jgi:hypothetical protein